MANLETKLWAKIPTNTLVQMKGNLSQIYPIPFPTRKKDCIYQFQGENLFTNLLSKFERNLHNTKFDAITAIAPLHWVAKLVQIYFFVLCPRHNNNSYSFDTLAMTVLSANPWLKKIKCLKIKLATQGFKTYQ